MKLTFQLMIESDDQPLVITELLSVDRSTVDPGNVGLQLREARELLAQSHTAMVTALVKSFIATASQCPSCYRPLALASK